jgi:hypothetical protein
MIPRHHPPRTHSHAPHTARSASSSVGTAVHHAPHAFHRVSKVEFVVIRGWGSCSSSASRVVPLQAEALISTTTNASEASGSAASRIRGLRYALVYGCAVGLSAARRLLGLGLGLEVWLEEGKGWWSSSSWILWIIWVRIIMIEAMFAVNGDEEIVNVYEVGWCCLRVVGEG